MSNEFRQFVEKWKKPECFNENECNMAIMIVKKYKINNKLLKGKVTKSKVEITTKQKTTISLEKTENGWTLLSDMSRLRYFNKDEVSEAFETFISEIEIQTLK